MIYIISGTNRPQSRTRKISQIIHNIYNELGISNEILDLQQLAVHEFSGEQYGEHEHKLKPIIQKILASQGLVIVSPEYNGSFPGILKYFIDHWPYPAAFEGRPICLIGLGGRFGAVRPIEHLQQIFGYRNAYVFPVRVFLPDIWNLLSSEGELKESKYFDMLKTQAITFQKFIIGLESQKLDARSMLSQPVK